MKTLKILLVFLSLILLGYSDDTAPNLMNISANINISVLNQAGENLLDPNQSGSYDPETRLWLFTSL
ncbi:hypothetical protein ACFOUP_04880 [Belliella kenyensis]|uniref:Uncharacterized protein n=1 Tax=Belliella kenyensis TaxID=1472724 RepID=A0ABV8EKN7_9BACT|nr:hypothetical protein [Belliella kenyensis]MCH7403501.1 hypothetical protein [Belliella kenyensis]MDN3602400.1 hypothetical protein [Belliella kenyensis]